MAEAPEAGSTFAVLLVEDNRGDARLVQELLKDADASFEVTHVERLAEARTSLMQRGAGCVLLDLSLPDASRLEALMQLRAAAPEVPIVILSGMQDELLAVKAVQEGAQDYLIKGRVDGHALGRSIAYAIERKLAEAELAHRALHDALTGLPNRSLFLDRLKHAVMRAKRHESLLGVMFVDLDHFKPVNDAYGHEMGDRLLVALAQRLREGLRGSDTAARYGGDEFLILCEDIAGKDDVIHIATRLLRAVAEPFVIGGERLQMNASAGIVISDGNDDSAENLIRNADAAMYGAKRHGRGYEIYDDGMRLRVRERVQMERDLRLAAEDGGFRLLYQPQVDLRSGEIVGLEALLRWDHPTRGLVEPAEFLWLAEESGVISQVGDWVLTEAAREANALRGAGPGGGPLKVAVNISARQHDDPALVDTVRTTIEVTGVEPSSLCLEINEEIVMRDTGRALETLAALKELGVAIAMDDFGSGQSSLGTLKLLPLDILKIDRSFVSGLGSEPEDAAIVTAVVNMAHALGLLTIADGVETREQLEHLRVIGCGVGQGFYFARPRPREAIAELLGTAV